MLTETMDIEEIKKEFNYWGSCSSVVSPTSRYTRIDRLLNAKHMQMKPRRGKQQSLSPPMVCNMPVLSKIEMFASMLTLDNFRLGQALGRGSFGAVHEAHIFDKKVAVKVIHKPSDPVHREQLFRSYLSERNIKNLRHRNIVQFIACNEAQNEHEGAYIVYEYGGKMNLHQVIMNSQFDLNVYRRKCFSLDLVNALEYLHANHIVHMDLKPSNIIVTDSLVCKLTDFGCSIKLEEPNIFGTFAQRSSENNNLKSAVNLNFTNFGDDGTESSYTDSRWTAGTWFYRAPELFKKDNYISNSSHYENVSTACDIYSLAICMWQLLARDHPYGNENPHVAIYQIVSNNLRPEYPDADGLMANIRSESLREKRLAFERIYRVIVEKCWESDASRRYTAKHIKSLLSSNMF